MSDLAWTAVGSALSLGLLTAISPCPMATNIAAISFLGRRVGQPRLVLLSGILYTLGRTTAYVGLAGLITAGLLISSDIARLLQTYMNKALGPILILLGMVLLGWIGSGLSWSLGGKDLQKQVESGGIGWACRPVLRWADPDLRAGRLTLDPADRLRYQYRPARHRVRRSHRLRSRKSR